MSAEQTPAEKERASLYRLKPSVHDALVAALPPGQSCGLLQNSRFLSRSIPSFRGNAAT
jgi:hypothetical protein